MLIGAQGMRGGGAFGAEVELEALNPTVDIVFGSFGFCKRAIHDHIVMAKSGSGNDGGYTYAAAAGTFLRLRQRGNPKQARNGPRFPTRRSIGLLHFSHFWSVIWGGGR